MGRKIDLDVALNILQQAQCLPHPDVAGEAFLMGFNLIEEKDGRRADVRYGPAETVDQVFNLVPKVRSYLAQTEAALLVGGGGGATGTAEPAGTPEGWNSEALAAMKWLSTPIEPGKVRPAGAGTPAPRKPLTEEESEEEEPWDSRRIKALCGGPRRDEA